MLLLVAFTIFMAGVRQKRPLDNNWPLLYWFLVLVFVLIRPEETFNFNVILFGLLCGLLLRFEFMNQFFINVFRVLEIAVFVYIVYMGIALTFF